MLRVEGAGGTAVVQDWTECNGTHYIGTDVLPRTHYLEDLHEPPYQTGVDAVGDGRWESKFPRYRFRVRSVDKAGNVESPHADATRDFVLNSTLIDEIAVRVLSASDGEYLDARTHNATTAEDVMSPLHGVRVELDTEATHVKVFDVRGGTLHLQAGACAACVAGCDCGPGIANGTFLEQIQTPGSSLASGGWHNY